MNESIPAGQRAWRDKVIKKARQKMGKLPKDYVLHADEKISRNAKCPCGSGRKYKRCCLLELEMLTRKAVIESRKQAAENKDSKPEE